MIINVVCAFFILAITIYFCRERYWFGVLLGLFLIGVNLFAALN